MAGTGGWWTLLSIIREEQAQIPAGPVSCPNDGEPLITGPDGLLFCRFDGWRPDHAEGA